MKTNKGLYAIEKQINAHLTALPANKRPELSSRRRAQSVAVITRGFQATDANGNVESITVDQGMAWLNVR